MSRARVAAKLVGLCYFLPAALRRAAQRAFIDSESLRRPAAVRPRFFFGAFAAIVPPPALRLAAQRAFIDSESLRRPAAVKPLRRAGVEGAAVVAVVPLRRAQRARAAAASLARVAADMGRRLPRPRRRPPRPRPEVVLVLPPKRVVRRSWSASICFRIESACVSWLRDKSMGPVDSSRMQNCKRILRQLNGVTSKLLDQRRRNKYKRAPLL